MHLRSNCERGDRWHRAEGARDFQNDHRASDQSTARDDGAPPLLVANGDGDEGQRCAVSLLSRRRIMRKQAVVFSALWCKGNYYS